MAFNQKRGRGPKTFDEGIQGLKVEVKNGDFGKALRLFKKKVQEDGILQDLRDREFYEKPSVKRNKAKKAARNRHLKTLAKEQAELGNHPFKKR